VTAPTSVAAEIERLAHQGATPGELLGMLPVPDLRAAIETLDEAIEGWSSYGDKLAAVQIILQAELDSRH
jgi:hypothetical protein